MTLEKKLEIRTRQLDKANELCEIQKREINEYKIKLEQANKLVASVEPIRKEWESLVEEMREKIDEYNILIAQLRILSKAIKK